MNTTTAVLSTEEEITPAAPVGPVELCAVDLAAMLNGRLCHDLISPTSALTSALDLLDDPDAQDMRDDALELIKASVGQLASKLSFARVAFGAASSAQAFEARDLRALIDTAFQKSKAEIVWGIDDRVFSKPAGRALVNLGLIAAECLPRGGTATFSAADTDDAQIITIHATGPRAKLRTETASGLRAEPAPEGLVGLWIQPYYARALVHSIGGSIAVETGEEWVSLAATLPHAPSAAAELDAASSAQL